MHLLLLTLLLVTQQQVKSAITPLDKVDEAGIARLKAMGPEALPHLARIYTQSNENDRAVIAWIFYSIGAKSPEARKVLLQDIHTQNEKLRLQVQWALGRVSDDMQIVDILIGIMREDPNALFRDKAACALAYDQIHLTEKQKVLLYRKLIDALDDPKPQVRAIAIQALSIHTGQTKGFKAGADAEARAKSIAAWRSWLTEYEKNL